MSLPRVLVLGNHGLWHPPLFGSQLRSARIAQGLASEFPVIYACAGSFDDDVVVQQWAQRHGIDGVIIGASGGEEGAARWGGPFAVASALLPAQVPVDVGELVSADLVDRIRRLIQTGGVDVVWAHRAWMAEAALQAGAKAIVCDVDDFQHAIAEQKFAQLLPFRRAPIHRVLNRRLRGYESRLADRFAAVVLTKEEDRQLLSVPDAQNVSVVPNGFDLPAIADSPEGTPGSILFVGALGYGPNIDAAVWFVEDVLPRISRQVPGVQFVMAGRGPVPDRLVPLMRSPHCRLVESPLDLTPLYREASIVVTPIRFGHGTRIKALEALAYGRPLVATSEALRGHPIRDREHALIADTTSAYADACVYLIENRNEAAEMARQGRELAERLGGWGESARRAIAIVAGMS